MRTDALAQSIGMRADAASRITRLARLLAIAVIVGVGLSQVILTVSDWHLRDADAYWQAALRLKAGEPLYPPLVDPEASEVYRYAPWFAWLWVPLTYLPHELVRIIWSIVLLVASAAALVPLIRAQAWLLVAFFGFLLVGISGSGNVQALLIACLVWGLQRRSGPVWIALGASLKVVPILFVVTYLGRRQWGRAAATIGLTALVVAPMLLYDLAHYPASPGAAAALAATPILYAAVLAAGIVISVGLARTRFAWLASASTVTIAVPRFFVYDVTFLMPSVPADIFLPPAEEEGNGR